MGPEGLRCRPHPKHPSSPSVSPPPGSPPGPCSERRKGCLPRGLAWALPPTCTDPLLELTKPGAPGTLNTDQCTDTFTKVRCAQMFARDKFTQRVMCSGGHSRTPTMTSAFCPHAPLGLC